MSDDETETTINVQGLEDLIRVMSAKAPVARIGVLGDKSARDASKGGKLNPTNAEIGAAHEFGTEKLPQRSFLRVPISEHLEKKMEEAGAFDADVLSDAIKSKTLVPYMKKIAVLGESIVQEAFDTGGFGKWPESDMTRKKNHQTLVETKQLRDSITSEVREAGGDSE